MLSVTAVKSLSHQLQLQKWQVIQNSVQFVDPFLRTKSFSNQLVYKDIKLAYNGNKLASILCYEFSEYF